MGVSPNLQTLPAPHHPERLRRLRKKISENQLGSLLVTSLTNIRYLTGFTGSAALLIVTPDMATLTTDGRYRTQAAEQLDAARLAGSAEQVDLVVGRVDVQREGILKVVRGTAPGRIGLEAEHLAWASELRWAEHLAPCEPVATSDFVEELRIVKDEGEVARIHAAAQIADVALGEILPMIEQSHTESEVALALDVAMRRLGAEDRAFETIVASGPNSAKPHAEPGTRVISAGDPVVIDFGAVVDGYRSDMTRTFFAGGVPSARMAEVYESVLGSQAAGVAAVSSGVTGGAVDEVCRKYLTDVGLGEAFEHGTGHGVGLDIHEAPAVGKGSTGILPEGATVTVEPGAYLAGIGGVRIEDTLVVTSDGRRALTAFTKDFSVKDFSVTD
jgi:Xaa-Pro aminopeptidase